LRAFTGSSETCRGSTFPPSIDVVVSMSVIVPLTTASSAPAAIGSARMMEAVLAS
jgi:hypothetical protein